MRMKIGVFVVVAAVLCMYRSLLCFVLCIDGGGSKTALQIVDDHGIVLPLKKKGVSCSKVESGGSNINAVGVDDVRRVLHDLIENVQIGDGPFIRDILPTCSVVAGMAGINDDTKQSMIHLFEELGVETKYMSIIPDGLLALRLVHGDGAVLIAGTGSVCLGKKGDREYWCGGLGHRIGDEGSGYFVGLQAIKSALEYEFGWGKHTSLTAELCKLYNVPQLACVMKDLYKGTVTPAQIGRAAPVVVAQALARDEQAVAIMNNAAAQLGDLVVTALTLGDLSDCELHLWGGLFKSDVADVLIKAITEHPLVRQRRITIVNQACQNVATLFVQKKILESSSEHGW